jgi:mono/diheme cytochrome c family protein
MTAGKLSAAAFLRWVGGSLALAVIAGSAHAQLSDAALRGRRLYRDGLGADARPLMAVNGESGVALPPAFVACANCHGYDGRGKTEAGITSSDIRAGSLDKAYSNTPIGNRPRPPYNEQTFFSALTRGVDSSGRSLHPAMPRYQLSSEEAAALFAYLKTGIAQVSDEGVTDQTIQIGYLSASAAAPGDEADSDYQILSAWFADINQSGGLYRRRLVLRRVESSVPAVASQPLLAAFASDGATVENAGNLPVLRVHSTRSVKFPPSEFSLYPGLADRTRALIRYALAHAPVGNLRIALLHEATPSATEAATALSTLVGPLAPLQAVSLTSENAGNTAATLRTAGVTTVLFLSADKSTETFLLSAKKIGWEPQLLWPARPSLDSARTARALTVQLTRETEVTPQAVTDHQHWAARHGLPGRDLARQLALVALAQVFVESLKTTGHELSRARLRDTLESLRDFRTGLTPPLGFTTNRHIALSGVYVVPVTGPLGADPSWIDLDR